MFIAILKIESKREAFFSYVESLSLLPRTMDEAVTQMKMLGYKREEFTVSPITTEEVNSFMQDYNYRMDKVS